MGRAEGSVRQGIGFCVAVVLVLLVMVLFVLLVGWLLCRCVWGGVVVVVGGWWLPWH